MLPIEPTGMENEFDEIFKLSSKDGNMVVESENVGNNKEGKEFSADMFFEQEPDVLISAIMPLFLSS